MAVEIKLRPILIEPFTPAQNPVPGNNHEPITENLVPFDDTIEHLRTLGAIRSEDVVENR